MIDYREIKFEEAIEHYLTHSGGYSKADPKNFDAGRPDQDATRD